MGVALRAHARAGAGPERVPGRLVFIGRLVEKKGVGVLLDALHDLPADLEWSLDIVGDGPLRAELEERRPELGDRVVTFHGQRSPSELGSACSAGREVAVFPSVRARSGDQDGLPVALLEAMAAGTPVVASDLPGTDGRRRRGRTRSRRASSRPATTAPWPPRCTRCCATRTSGSGSHGRGRRPRAERRTRWTRSARSTSTLLQDASRRTIPDSGGRRRVATSAWVESHRPVRRTLLISTRAWSDAVVAEIARTAAACKVLEIGSGRQDLGADAYSLEPALPDADSCSPTSTRRSATGWST